MLWKRGVDKSWHSAFEFSQTSMDVSLLKQEKESCTFFHEIWKYFLFHRFDNRFLNDISVLISFFVHIMNDS